MDFICVFIQRVQYVWDKGTSYQMYLQCCQHFVGKSAKRYNQFSGREEGTLGCLLHQSPKFYNKIKRFLIRWLINFGTFIDFDGLVQRFLSQIIIYRRDNFVYHHWGYTINLSAIVFTLPLDLCRYHILFTKGCTPNI